VAVVGRQNVGKSTLVNRLLGVRKAIADERPGVTRDRLEVPATWRGRSFLVVDTGGHVEGARGIEELVAKQAERAAVEAQVVLLVVDAETGVQEEDAALARRLQRTTVPVVVVANKIDSARREPEAADFYRLGLGEPIPVSALHGRGSGELLDRILTLLPDEADLQADVAGEERTFALVGRPNVGKSSLFNRLVGEDRAVVYEEAGTTRDAVDSLVRWDGEEVRFVDTAGFRRPSKARGVEYYGYVRTVQAIDRSHVVALLVDAAEGVTTEDRRIAARVAEAGRGLVAVANKWDLAPSGERAKRFTEIKERLEVFPGVPLLRTSALSGAGVGKVIPALLEVHGHWLRRIPTSDVNRLLQRAQGRHPPPGGGRLMYGTQVSAGPPRFVIFGTGETYPDSYARFIENRLREAFGFAGVPIRLSFRRRRR
jgi:GTP-binding protein